MGTLATYKPLYVWCSPASIPQIVAHIQDYLVKNPIVSTETVAEIVVQSLQEHPELINGSVIPITEDSAQSIKDYIDALPSIDGYTKAETDALLLLKQNLLTWDQTPTAGSSNPVTSEGIKAAISATAAALADLISTKADIASVYTKATTDALLLQKADAATTYSKNAVDALLDTKVDINDTYTKADIDLMKQVDKANTAIVTDGTAPFNIAAGQYLYVNDILYMATEAIPENDPLIPGTNIVLTPKGVTNNIGDGLQNLVGVVNQQSDQIGDVYKATFILPDISSLTDLKSKLLTIASGMDRYTNKSLAFWISADSSPFIIGSDYIGYLHIAAKSENLLNFSCDFTSNIGDLVIVGYNNGTWTVNGITDQIANQGKAIAKVENGTTATQTINPGDYVYRNGVLYKYGGSTAIAQGTTIPAFSDTWIVSGGGLNDLNNKVNDVNFSDWSTWTSYLNQTEIDGGSSVYAIYSGHCITISITTASRVHAENDVIMTIPEGYRPLVTLRFIAKIGQGQTCVIQINLNGTVVIWDYLNSTNGRLVGAFTYVL